MRGKRVKEIRYLMRLSSKSHNDMQKTDQKSSVRLMENSLKFLVKKGKALMMKTPAVNRHSLIHMMMIDLLLRIENRNHAN